METTNLNSRCTRRNRFRPQGCAEDEFKRWPGTFCSTFKIVCLLLLSGLGLHLNAQNLSCGQNYTAAVRAGGKANGATVTEDASKTILAHEWGHVNEKVARLEVIFGPLERFIENYLSNQFSCPDEAINAGRKDIHKAIKVATDLDQEMIRSVGLAHRNTGAEIKGANWYADPAKNIDWEKPPIEWLRANPPEYEKTDGTCNSQ